MYSMDLTNLTWVYEVHERRTQPVVHRRSTATTCRTACQRTVQMHERTTYDAEVESAVGERHL